MLHVYICDCVCVDARRRWWAFPDGQRDRRGETDSGGEEQTQNSSAASSGHGKINKLIYESHNGLEKHQLILSSLSVSCTQAYQDDDPRKYSVATVLVRVMAVNQFYPQFDRAEYNGFVTPDKSPASLVNTYGSKALMLHVQDQDFNNVCTATCTHTAHEWCKK